MKIGVNSVWKKTYFFLIFDITYGDHRDRDHIVVEFISICAVTAKAVTRCSQYLSLVTWYLALDEVYSVVVSCDVVSRPWGCVLSSCLLWRGISSLTWCTQWLSLVAWNLARDDAYSAVVLWCGISPLNFFFLLLEKKNYLLNFIDIKSSDIYKICYMRHQIIITNTKYY